MLLYISVLLPPLVDVALPDRAESDPRELGKRGGAAAVGPPFLARLLIRRLLPREVTPAQRIRLRLDEGAGGIRVTQALFVIDCS